MPAFLLKRAGASSAGASRPPGTAGPPPAGNTGSDADDLWSAPPSQTPSSPSSSSPSSGEATGSPTVLPSTRHHHHHHHHRRRHHYCAFEPRRTKALSLLLRAAAFASLLLSPFLFLLLVVVVVPISRQQQVTLLQSGAWIATGHDAHAPSLLGTGGGGGLAYASRAETQGEVESPALTDRRSALERLYEATQNGTKLKEWARNKALATYPSLPDDGGLMVGNPSLAHDPATNRTVLGFRIQTRSLPKALLRVRYLMLCEPVLPEAHSYDSALPSSSAVDVENGSGWRCQDSGWDNSYIPPECDPRYWQHAALHIKFHAVVVGPEDARLYFDENGDLGGTVVLRGCHPGTMYGNHTPLWSVYAASWVRSNAAHGRGGMWRRNDYPKLLDLRAHDGSALGDAYPMVTKSWITIPQSNGQYASLSGSSPEGLRYSVGWTRDMKDHIVYGVVNGTTAEPASSSSSETLHAVVPVRRDTADYSMADLSRYRASTNFVAFRGALLGLGHRQVRVPRTAYHHYWYAFCPNEPYRAVALSDDVVLSPKRRSKILFALGLAHEADFLYVTYSVWDKLPALVRVSADDVWGSFRNSTFAMSRGDAAYYDRFDGFASMCAADRSSNQAR